VTSAELDRIALKMHELDFTGICLESQEHGGSVVRGIHVGTHFFPASELDDADNVGLLLNGMFTHILAKRAIDKTD
jgi:hypothetical protein